MPQDSSLEVAGRIDDWWSLAKHDISTDPFGRMARAGLCQIGLPDAGPALDTYRAIAAAEQAIAAKTGLLGLASAFAARQMTARFFIAGLPTRTSALHGFRVLRPARFAQRSRSPSLRSERIRSF